MFWCLCAFSVVCSSSLQYAQLGLLSSSTLFNLGASATHPNHHGITSGRPRHSFSAFPQTTQTKSTAPSLGLASLRWRVSVDSFSRVVLEDTGSSHITHLDSPARHFIHANDERIFIGGGSSGIGVTYVGYLKIPCHGGIILLNVCLCCRACD